MVKKLWSRLFGTPEYDTARGVASSSNGSVYVCGMTEGNLDGKTNAGLRDYFFN